MDLREETMTPRPRHLIPPLVVGLTVAAIVLGGTLGAQPVDTGDGESLYQTHCVACHLPTGDGIPGAFPPLAGHVPELLAVEGGREYAILVVLYGLAGPITVHGQTYDGIMPPLPYLTDEEVADVLNYVATAWGHDEALPEDFEPYAPEDVAEHRDEGLMPADVHAVRQELELEE
jgi:mono/diheme cytochrome c family protein